jgi:hypothetical protein
MPRSQEVRHSIRVLAHAWGLRTVLTATSAAHTPGGDHDTHDRTTVPVLADSTAGIGSALSTTAVTSAACDAAGIGPTGSLAFPGKASSGCSRARRMIWWVEGLGGWA